MRPLSDVRPARGHHRALSLLAFALASALAGPARAQSGDETLLLDVCVNDRCVGVAAVVARGDDVLVDRQALDAAGVDASAVTPERIGETDFVSLHALNHGSRFAIDRTQLRLDLRLRPEQLPRQRTALHDHAAAELPTRPWTAFVNYAATVGQSDERSLFVDSAVGRGNAALRTTALWNDQGGWRRGLTRFEIDQPQALRRWTIGDQYALPRDPLGGGLLLGGVGVERAFDEDPYLVTFPQPTYSGVLESPGTVEIYANGVLIGRRELQAGPFDLDQLGLSPGRNDVQVVVRDPFGNRSELATRSYYGSGPSLLAKGLSEYALRIGAPRRGGGFDDHYVDDAVLQGWYRRGIDDAWTLGGRIEGDRHLRNAGLDSALRMPVGELAVTVAASDADGVGRGAAWAFTYGYTTRRWSLDVGLRRANAAYRTLADSTASLLGVVRVDDYASVSFAPDARWSLQLSAGRRQRDGQALQRSAGIAGNLRLGRRTRLLFSLDRSSVTGGNHDTIALLSLDIGFDRDSVSLSARQHDNGNESMRGYGFDARRSRPPGVGWGYDLSLQRDDTADSGFGQVEYQGAYGRYTLEADRFDDDSRVRATASGALVAVGGRVFVTPPVDSGFALVRVPGLAGVPILRENLEVGRTDAHGDLLVRDLLPFYANRIALDEAAVPPGYDLRVPRRDVQVPRNAGALVMLDAPAVRAVTGRFRHAGAAAGDRVQVAGASQAQPLGDGGLFYLEGLPTARQTVRVDGAAGPFSCTFDMPAAADPGIRDVGDIECGEAP